MNPVSPYSLHKKFSSGWGDLSVSSDCHLTKPHTHQCLKTTVYLPEPEAASQAPGPRWRVRMDQLQARRHHRSFRPLSRRVHCC